MYSSELNCMWYIPLGSCGVTASADCGRVELGGATLPEIGVRLLRHLWRSGWVLDAVQQQLTLIT